VCRDGGIDRFCTVLVDSACVGVRKPDPRIFRHALDALRLAPRDAVFVGDSATRDMAGARGVGMPHAWLVRRDATPPPPCCPGDPVIGSLDELEKLLP
jgi:putative hydrolase of the HAD superfamily